MSSGEVKTWCPDLIWETLVDLHWRDWSSLINRHVLRVSHLLASSFSEKYLRLAFLIELFTLFLASLSSFQIRGSFVDVSFFFKKPLLWISPTYSFVIHGDLLFLILFIFKGACLSITLIRRCFQEFHISFGLLSMETRFDSFIWRSRKNSSSLKFLSCRTSAVLWTKERKCQILRVRKMAQWSLMPMSTTPELDILSGELVEHKSMRVRECCVTRVGSVISWVRP